jgi:hypothetical protein
MKKKACALLFTALLAVSFCAGEALCLEKIKLPAPDMSGGKPLMAALKERKSTRTFVEKELPLNVLSGLLWASSGVNRPDTFRITSPTARNWQEIDVYVAMKDGLYVYNRKEHSLDPCLEGDIREFVGLQGFVKVAPVGLIYVADLGRMDGDIKDRMFYAATDTGFVSQNVYLYCASEDLATVVLGWVDKKALKQKMGLASDKEIILTQPVGYSSEQ